MRIQLSTFNYPFSFFVFLFIFLSIEVFSQDRITTKAGTVLNVKIIHVDAENIFFHQSIDTSKTIRKVSQKSISNYEYNSIENGSNKNVLTEDSLMFVCYLRDVEGIYYTNNHELININEQKKMARRDSLAIVKLNKIPTAKKRFSNAGSCLIAASVFLVAGSAINIYAENRKIKDNPYQYEIDIFNEDQKFLRTGAYLCYGFSGLFILGAGINLESGAMQLKP